MKLDIIVVEVILVALVLAPYVVFTWAGYKKSRQLKRKFSEEAKKYNFQPNEIGTWNRNMAGLDSLSRSFLLVQDYLEEIEVIYLDFKMFRKCSIIKSYETIKIREKEEEVLQNIYLELLSHSGEFKIVNLYDSNRTYEQDYEVKNAEKWNLLINSCLSSKPVLDAAA